MELAPIISEKESTCLHAPLNKLPENHGCLAMSQGVDIAVSGGHYVRSASEYSSKCLLSTKH